MSGEGGIDEAGRGALAGPVVAACVSWETPVAGCGDSKALSPARRERIMEEILASGAKVGVGLVGGTLVDLWGVLEATMRAMRLAWSASGLDRETPVLVDGNRLPDLPCPARAVPKADATVAVVGAASIVAKVSRDAILRGLDGGAPGYGLWENKGYGTPSHREALERMGPAPCHRRSFRPVALSALLGDGGR